VRDTGETFKLIENIKKISENVNSYISIYSDTVIEIGNITFPEKYKMPAKRANREIVTDIKNSALPYYLSKRRKLTRL
jgi:hypothetical protein